MNLTWPWQAVQALTRTAGSTDDCDHATLQPTTSGNVTCPECGRYWEIERPQARMPRYELVEELEGFADALEPTTGRIMVRCSDSESNTSANLRAVLREAAGEIDRLEFEFQRADAAARRLGSKWRDAEFRLKQREQGNG